MNVMSIGNDGNIFVVDDILPTDVFDSLSGDVHEENFTISATVSAFTRLWYMDGIPSYSSRAYQWQQSPTKRWVHFIGGVFKNIANTLELQIPNPLCLRLHAHLCCRGVKLDWHVDTDNGISFTYWVHKEWKPEWGGELLIGGKGNNKDAHSIISDSGVGTYVIPKPNRCVIMLPGVLHSIARVDPNAGNAARCSIIGFMSDKMDEVFYK